MFVSLAWRNVQPSISGCNINKGIIEAATYTTKNAKYTCYSLLFPTTTTVNDVVAILDSRWIYMCIHAVTHAYQNTHIRTHTHLYKHQNMKIFTTLATNTTTISNVSNGEWVSVCVCVNERVSIRWYVKYDYDIIILVVVVVHAQVVAEPFFVYFLMLPLCWNLFFFSLFDEGTTTATIQ